MPVYQLNQELKFPHPSLAEEDGVLAVGGDLSVNRLLLAYTNGIFPWYNDDQPIIWYAPNPRFILFPEKVKVSKSMRKFMANTNLKVTQNEAFEEVIRNCKQVNRPGQDGTWIHEDIINAYLQLNSIGFGHSVEVWDKDKLVGGLYGVQLGDTFFGESMFHLVPNASKMAFIHLCKKNSFHIIDCQMRTNHLESLGGEYIALEEFLEIVRSGIKRR